MKILFLHNKAISYRIPLFTRLRETFGDAIEFWFYNEEERPFPGRYFAFWGKRIPFSFSCITALLFEKNYELVVLAGAHVYELFFFLAILKMRRKKIVFWTETWQWKPMSIMNCFFLKLISFAARYADVVIYPGGKVHDFYASLNIPETKQIFAPNASATQVHTVSRLQTLLRPSPKKTVVYLGRIIERKGLNDLIAAFQCLEQGVYRLLIGGSGDATYTARCKKAAAHSAHIHFLGNITTVEVGALLNAADVFVYPSLNVRGVAEPWGLAINEAVGLMKPVVATTAVAAAYDLIEIGKNGYIVAQGDPDALATAIRQATSLPRATVEATSRALSERYSYTNMAQGFIEAIQKAYEQAT